MIQKKWIQIGTCLMIVFGLGAASVLQAADGQGPCEQIMAACRNAGFVQGGASKGNGLLADCVNPIMQGKAQPRKASKPLPQIDPQLVEACRAKSPGFGQPKGRSSEMDAQQSLTGAPSPETVQSIPSQVTRTTAKGSNIVFILTDDLSLNLVQYMPHVLKMQNEGVTFTNYFVTDSLCCPSRSSIFTGRYPHNTGVFRNRGNDGGVSGLS